ATTSSHDLIGRTATAEFAVLLPDTDSETALPVLERLLVELAGPEIPFGSRVIIVAATYHAITSDRPYRAARAHDVAIDELTRCAGTQFDPDVAAALIGHLYGRRQGGAISA
ncbi:MAG: hypothetical protein M3065_14950, partial [Actinomycetota bacterium]|nr:hypothetical protein [Actinomycetota bacterium]